MNAHDQDRIDKVLQSLGQSEPAAGMQQRIVAALHRAEQSSDGKASRGLPTLFRFPHATALSRLAIASAVVLAATALLLQPRHRVKPDSAHGPGVARMPQPATKFANEGEAHSLDDLQVAAPSRPPTHGRTHVPVADSSLRDEPQERSFPAPPLPLTEQERLLIRLIRREAPVQLAQLTTPAINAARQQETDEVTAFFAPHLPLIEELQAPAEPPVQGSSDPAQNLHNEVNKEIQ